MVIKVCGMKEAENIRAVSQADIQWMGFIFYPKSARYYTAPSIDLPERIKRIGVFVNASLEEMLRKKEHFRLDYLQLHGEESPELCREAQASGARIIKAIPIAKKEDLLRTERYTDCVDYFLFDTKCPGFGGSGKRFDWSLLESYQGEIPFLLSGGLAPDCLEALKDFHHPKCMGVDLNSGFEIRPGIKDYVMLNEFINRLKTKTNIL